MSNEHVVDVEFEDDKYYTLEDVARITNLTEAKISFYCTKLNNFLNIQSIGMYQIFSATDIDNLNKIKKLESQKGMSISEIEKYLKANKQEVLLKREDNKIDMSFLDFFAKILEIQNKKIDQMVDINQQLIEALNKNNQSNSKLLETSDKIQEDLKNTITKTIDDKMNNIDSELSSKMDELVNNVKEEIRTSYVSREEIESLKRKKSFFGWLKK